MWMYCTGARRVPSRESRAPPGFENSSSLENVANQRPGPATFCPAVARFASLPGVCAHRSPERDVFDKGKAGRRALINCRPYAHLWKKRERTEYLRSGFGQDGTPVFRLKVQSFERIPCRKLSVPKALSRT